MTTRIGILIFGLGFALATSPARPANPTNLLVRTEPQIERTIQTGRGMTEVVREEIDRPTPGVVVIYSIHYEVGGAEPAEHAIVTEAVPAGMACLGVDTRPETHLAVSVDGGRTFGAIEHLRVTDAVGRRRAARWSDCTHVRWTFREPLAPGARGELSYRASLK